MKTQNGIELNLKESKYTVIFRNFTFFFSSQFYKNKFIENVENYIEFENRKLMSKYKVNSSFSLYFAISLYKKIEKRGFRIINELGIEVTDESYFKDEIKITI